MTKTVLSYGAGTNSTAMLVGLSERGERPDAILFADTGGERPSTYAHIAEVSAWCVANGFPEITIVRAPGKTLEQDCLDRNALPAIAYGFKTCSLLVRFWSLALSRSYFKVVMCLSFVRISSIICCLSNMIRIGSLNT